MGKTPRAGAGISGRGPKKSGTKVERVSAKGSPGTKGGNSGGSKEGGERRVQSNNHQGGSLGKRNSG